MNLNSNELRKLRYRLGWSMAEMARCLKLDLIVVQDWEAGRAIPDDERRNLLINIMSQAETNSECVQRRPIAEVVMRTRNLCQIHNFDLLDSEDTIPGSRVGKA